ncbi:aspartic proteinase CDR1-like [Prosopis cineraria]|uniref:aspartic proteinase CDR1-like n=1 Tax=Prosopis cineraria TaxID=364024 RepID=UPI00240FBC6C|nr:aspartic proteinase CDR1-like [Prosopis cineraria]
MAASSSKPYLLVSQKIFIIIIFSSVISSVAKAKTKHGFTVELIHRDSPKSPFYNNYSTPLSPFQRVDNALRRSFKRVNHLLAKSAEVDIADEDAESEVFYRDGEFLMTYSLGTPGIGTNGILDTGSNLVWLQCEPCDKCFDQTLPKFHPTQSSSYVSPNCNTPRCQFARASVDKISCSDSLLCGYEKSYVNGFVSKGVISYDTLTLSLLSGSRAAFPRTAFGCGHDNGGVRVSSQTSGVVGLGRGRLSLISQMGPSFKGKFSYCLIDPFFSDVSSTLSFGQSAEVSGPGTVSTPIASTVAKSNLYYLTLDGISVGDTKLDFIAGNVSSSNIKVEREGNMIIDSGATLTALPEEFYLRFEEQVAKLVDPLSRRVNSPRKRLRLCYSRSRVENVGAPTIVVHFRGGNVKLSAKNSFVKVAPKVICLAFRPVTSTSGSGIYGILAQINFLIGYDLYNNRLSFMPQDCSVY